MGFPSGSAVKNLPVMQETQEMCVQSLGQKDPLKEETATRSCILSLGNSVDRGAWQASVHGFTKRHDSTCIFYLFTFGMRDLSSKTRDQTHAHCIGSSVLTTRPPGKSSWSF